jgi:nucleoside-diphosphate-sugar epimerase/predicted dehydrogenase
LNTSEESFVSMSDPSSGVTRPFRVGLIGTGFIADYHAAALCSIPEVELAAVCDLGRHRAEAFARKWGVQNVYASEQQMLSEQHLDVVHILVPPDGHYRAATEALTAGAHVFIEKPMCTCVADAVRLQKLAQDRGLQIGINHNLLFYGVYQRLREDLRSGRVGQIDQFSIVHHCELGEVRSGPFDAWMLSAPGNIMLEIGPHPISMLLDLIGAVTDIDVSVGRCIELPTGQPFYRHWHVRAAAGPAAVSLSFSFVPGFPERSVHVRGNLGTATVDLEANTYVLDTSTSYGFDLDRYVRTHRRSRALAADGLRTFRDYLLTKARLSHRGNAYTASIVGSVRTFYGALKAGKPPDSRLAATFGCDVIEWCGHIAEHGLARAPAAAAPTCITKAPRPAVEPAAPKVLVIGGTGFIGRSLVRQLLEAGFRVRLMTRRSGAVPRNLDHPQLQVFRGSILNSDQLGSALDGVDHVYHLARANVRTWTEYYEQDVLPCKSLAEACLENGIKRLIYTGTIDSYYAGRHAGTITEETPLDPRIGRRNFYARSKAAAETILMDLHRKRGLPVVIFRPGIVVGPGGNTCHFGVGTWNGLGICQVWGDGNNKLPFVLVDDVAAALVSGIRVQGIEGRSYNLVDARCISAREYLQEIEAHAGVQLQKHLTPIWKFYAIDLIKWLAKVAMRHPGRERVPSFWDWESRTQKALFDCTRARTELDWKPASDRQRIIAEGIQAPLDELFG